MFSQFSQFRKRIEESIDAVESSLAFHPRDSSDHTSSTSSSPPSGAASNSWTRPSVDLVRTNSGSGSVNALADSARSNIRRTIAAQRPQSHNDGEHRAGPSRTLTPKLGRERDGEAVSSSPVRKSTMSLEERLRSAFTVGDASTTASEAPSPAAPRSPTPVPPPEPIPLPEPVSAVVPPITFPDPLFAVQDVRSVPARAGDEVDPTALPLPPSPVAPVSELAPEPTPEPPTLPPAPPPLPDDVLPTPPRTSSESEHLVDPTPDPTPAEPPLTQTTEEPASESIPEPPAQTSVESATPMPILSSLRPPADTEEVLSPFNDAFATALATPLPPSSPVDEDFDPAPQLARPLSELLEAHRRVSYNSENASEEKVKERLKLVEQRFSDVSTSFKRLQAEKRAADSVLRELTPVEGIADVDSLRDYLKNLSMKTELSVEEIKRLTAQIRQQEERMEELRDTHRLESRSQSDQIDKLRSQFAETEALLAAATASVARVEEESAKHKAETETLKTEVERAKAVGKEEEEKRVKAISLLKTVRTKLVKAEKDRDEAARERDAAKEEGVRERERGLAEKARLEGEVERARAERDKEVAALKAQFEKELAEVRDKFEKESAARKSQFELDAITSKAAYTKELNAKTARIAQLEASVRNMSQEKDSMFDQLQMRQAELESSQSHLESLQNQTMELQYQLREAADRTAVLSDELSEAQRQAETNGGLGGGVSHAEVARLISDAESKYEARLAELRTKIRVLERERVEAEEEWSKGLHSRSKEVERLRRELKEKEGEWKEEMRSAERRDEKVRELERALVRKDEEKERDRAERDSIRADLERAKEAEAAARQEREESESRISLLERQLEELKTRDVQLRANNKTIRDELRKLQSSAALLERQRNPGVGFWSNTSRANVSNPSSPPPDGPGVFSSPTSPRPSSPALSEQAGSIRHEEEVNLEYLRNVIMQFLEHKEMRPNLVRVLSVILRFTPQETRRLAAKV